MTMFGESHFSDVKGCLRMLIFTSLVADDVETVLLWFFVICIYPLEWRLFTLSAYFETKLSAFVLPNWKST